MPPFSRTSSRRDASLSNGINVPFHFLLQPKLAILYGYVEWQNGSDELRRLSGQVDALSFKAPFRRLTDGNEKGK